MPIANCSNSGSERPKRRETANVTRDMSLRGARNLAAQFWPLGSGSFELTHVPQCPAVPLVFATSMLADWMTGHVDIGIVSALIVTSRAVPWLVFPS